MEGIGEILNPQANDDVVRKQAPALIESLVQGLYKSHKRDFTPMYPWVFVYVLKGEQTRGSIVLPGKQNRTVYEGIVIKTWKPFARKRIVARDGNGKEAETYDRVDCESSLKPGDHVLFPHWCGMDIEGFSRDKFRVVKEDLWSISRDGGIFATVEYTEGKCDEPTREDRGCTPSAFEALHSLVEEKMALWPSTDADDLACAIDDRFLLVDRKGAMVTLSGR